MRQESPMAKSARNWRGTSDLTPSIRPIGPSHAISTSYSRGTGGPLSCKTATRISNPDTIAIRTGVPEGNAVIREPDSRNRIGPNRCFYPMQYDSVNADATTIFFLFFFLFSPLRSHISSRATTIAIFKRSSNFPLFFQTKSAN